MGSSNPWLDAKAPSAGFTLPVSMGPMTIPERKRKRRWGWPLVLLLVGFAGGIAAGPPLTDHAFTLVESAASLIRNRAPRFVVRLLPAEPVVEQVPAPRPVVARPSAPRAKRVVEPKKPAEVTPPRDPPEANRAPAPTPERAEIAPAERPATHPPRAKGSARTPAATGAPANAPASAPARKAGKYKDPFETGADGDSAPASASRVARPTSDDGAVTAKPEPASKPAPAKAHDGLDSLMADVVTENKGKGKKRESKDIDAMLKDVQKANPEPAVKREAPPPPPALTPADIAKAMTVVKARGKDCARRLGQTGVAELKITVGKDGKVTEAVVGGALERTPVAACIEKAARAAAFRPNAGLRFDYRIDVR